MLLSFFNLDTMELQSCSWLGFRPRLWHQSFHHCPFNFITCTHSPLCFPFTSLSLGEVLFLKIYMFLHWFTLLLLIGLHTLHFTPFSTTFFLLNVFPRELFPFPVLFSNPQVAYLARTHLPAWHCAHPLFCIPAGGPPTSHPILMDSSLSESSPVPGLLSRNPLKPLLWSEHRSGPKGDQAVPGLLFPPLPYHSHSHW